MNKIITQIKNVDATANALKVAGLKEVGRNNIFTMEGTTVAYLTKKLVSLGVRMRRSGEQYDRFEYGSSNKGIQINIEDLCIATGLMLQEAA